MNSTLMETICDIFNETEQSLHDDLDIRDLDEWDSMAHMLFITRLEQKFAIQLSGDDIVAMQTIADIRHILASNYGIDT